MANEVIKSFQDSEGHQKLRELHLDIHRLTLIFPKFELHKSDSQLRSSSNLIPANLTDDMNNKYINIYLEGINIAWGELRTIAIRKIIFLKISLMNILGDIINVERG